jgi:hypothetical protein
MFKITKSDLAAKSDVQLTALFGEASHAAVDPKAAPQRRRSAERLKAMIRAEIAARLSLR